MNNDRPPKVRFKAPATRLSLQDMPVGFVEALTQITEESPALVAYFSTEPMPAWAERKSA